MVWTNVALLNMAQFLQGKKLASEEPTYCIPKLRFVQQYNFIASWSPKPMTVNRRDWRVEMHVKH